MENCGCVGLRVNNDTIIKHCPLHAAASAMLAALTEGIGIPDSADFASDLEIIANFLKAYHPISADDLRRKAQAIRAAVADARGE